MNKRFCRITGLFMNSALVTQSFPLPYRGPSVCKASGVSAGSWSHFKRNGETSTRFARLYQGLALISLMSVVGCASKRPAPLVIERPIALTAQLDPDNGARLKLVTYNIWGLPGWMTGAHSGRYPKIAHELE